MVGDNATYGDYHNVPLSPDTVYVVYFVVAVAWDGVVKMAFAQLATRVRTAVDGVTAGMGPTTAADGPRSAGQSAPSSMDNDGQITTAIIVSAVLLALLIVAAVISVCWLRRRDSCYHRRDDVIGRTGNDVTGRDAAVSSRGASSMNNHTDRFHSDDVADDHVTGSGGEPRDLPVVDIADYRSVPFADEFRLLPTTDETDDATPSHRFLSGYRGRKRAYVVTGAPGDASAAYTYWAVIYQEGITHVVAVGGGATLHVPAEGEERQFGDVSVRTTIRRRLSHATTTTFQIRRTDDDSLPRTVRQYEFRDWPAVDSTVPSTPLPFAEFVEAVRTSSRQAQTGANFDPLLVQRSILDHHSGVLSDSWSGPACIHHHLLRVVRFTYLRE